MAGWLSLGSVVSDPWPDYADSELWGQLLPSAARHDHKLSGAELLPSARFGLRLVMANKATVTQQEARELLAPHSELLLNLFLHIGGGAGGQQKTDT